MEASVKAARRVGGEPAQRKLDSDKARRIIAAMRASVGTRGAAGATFDHVAQEAGVSRGLLHYYFGSKERLLAEVVRHDCELRMATLEERLAEVRSPDELVEVLVAELREFLKDDPEHDDPGAPALIFELFSASRRNEEIRQEVAELFRSLRGAVAEALREKEREGVVELRGDAEAIAAVLFALGDGVVLQLLSDPDWDSSETFRVGIEAVRHLLGADG